MLQVPSPVPLEVGVQDVQRLMAEKGADLRLIDVRDPDEYEYCRLAGAELMPLLTVPSDAPAKLTDKAADIIVYCHHGMRSMQAVERLRAMGYPNARSMAGGIDKWSHRRSIRPSAATEFPGSVTSRPERAPRLSSGGRSGK